jgi:hypothetical protein
MRYMGCHHAQKLHTHHLAGHCSLTLYELACFAAQVTLPVSLGGFGIRSMALWAPGATVATQNAHMATAKDLFARCGRMPGGNSPSHREKCRRRRP